MKKKNELRVRPVRCYRKPKYPSHHDPDPTLHPQPVPFPASRKLISAIAASAGMVVSAACTSPNDGPLAGVAPTDDNNSESVESQTPTTNSNATDLIDKVNAPVDPFGGDPFGGDPFGEGDQSSSDTAADPFGGSEASTADDPFGGEDPFGDSEEPAPAGDGEQKFEDFEKLIELIETTVAPEQWEDLGGPATMTAYPGMPGANAKAMQAQINKAGGNPLPVALSGLPHRTSGFGTGLPNYVQADLARRVIEKVFREAGYDLKANQQYDDGDVAFVMDGYDAKQKVGFVVADWSNLDNDAILHWWVQPATKSAAKYAAEIETLLQIVASDPAQKDLAADIQAAKNQPDPARRSAAFKAILTKHRKGLLSLEEMKKLQTQAKEKQDYIAVISCFDRRFAHPSYPHITSQEQAEINKIADPAKRQAATKKLMEQKAGHAVQALEKAAREYITWAQGQGLN